MGIFHRNRSDTGIRDVVDGLSRATEDGRWWVTDAGAAIDELLEYRRYVEACNTGVAGKLVPRDMTIETTPFECGQNPCAKCRGQMSVHTYHPARQDRPFISTQPTVARRLAAGEDVEYTVTREVIEWRCQTCGWVLITRCAGDEGEASGVGDA